MAWPTRSQRSAHVICFDELFVSDIADAMILGNLFEALLKRGVALVFTSNVKPKDLYKGGLQRERFLPTIALLEKHCEVVAVDGGVDYRLRQLTAAPIYLPSGAADTQTKLEELFDDLSDDDVESGGTITVNHRKIKVVRESENVIWFEFAALCEGPRSPADYVAIASEYQSVMIAGVPVFDDAADNAARRFISVIDEFYDRGVNVILSAAAAPAELYRGEKLKFEFQRTSSRLDRDAEQGIPGAGAPGGVMRDRPHPLKVAVAPVSARRANAAARPRGDASSSGAPCPDHNDIRSARFAATAAVLNCAVSQACTG